MGGSFRALSAGCATAVSALVVATLPADAPGTTVADPPTLAETVVESDAVVLGAYQRWGGDAAAGAASARFQARRVLKGDFEPGRTLDLTGEVSAEPGELFLLTRRAGETEWDFPVEFGEAAFDYLEGAPLPVIDGLDVPYRYRLPYYAAFLEHADGVIAEDAALEFSNAPYEDLRAARRAYSREDLRRWVLSPETPADRLATYGVMLGYIGNAEDAAALEEIVFRPTADFRIGIDGVMAGYLMLKGEPGLDLLQRHKLEPVHLTDEDGCVVLDGKGEPVEMPFSETYAAMRAVRFLWTHGEGRIDPERLREAMRALLGRPDLADLAIADLARWKDWEPMERVVGLYGAEGYEIPGVKRSIVRYLTAAAKDGAAGAMPGLAARARRHLGAINRKDPETVRNVRQIQRLIDGEAADDDRI